MATFRPTIARVSIGNIKKTTGREGYGLTCAVYIDGKKIGDYADYADGGEGYFYGEEGEENALKAICDTLHTNVYVEGHELPMHIDILIEKLEHLNDDYKEWKKAVKKGYPLYGYVYDDATCRLIGMYSKGNRAELVKLLVEQAKGFNGRAYSLATYGKEEDFILHCII